MRVGSMEQSQQDVEEEAKIVRSPPLPSPSTKSLAPPTDTTPEPTASATTTMPTPEPQVSTGNKHLEDALRRALDADDLGRLCKTLGEAYCLPARTPRVVGYDSGSDTTAPADQDQSSSESGAGSEAGGDASFATTAPAAAIAGTAGGGGKVTEGNVEAVATAAEVGCLSVFTARSGAHGWASCEITRIRYCIEQYHIFCCCCLTTPIWFCFVSSCSRAIFRCFEFTSYFVFNFDSIFDIRSISCCADRVLYT